VEDAGVESPVEDNVGSNGGFQQVVLEHLRGLCKDPESAEVLAEYVVAMVAGNKSRKEIATELEAFFSDFAQALSFAEWVDEVKVGFLTGKVPQVVPRKVSTPVKTKSVAAASSPAQRSSPLASSAVRPGPHVAVTARAVLQPNASFGADPPTAISVSAALSSQVRAGAPSSSPVSSPRQSLASAAAPSPNKAKDKKNLLESMTRQLQVILTKLNDPNMNDETREKYQALAQSVQTQMAKISRPPPRPKAFPPRHRRR
jgi:hypothetical protein